MRKFRLTLAALGALLALVLSACAGNADANDADVAFAAGMIPHHEQAIEMADLAEQRTDAPEVLDLAARIKAAQDPEIEQLSGMLESWGEHGAGDHGGHDDSMAGMMSDTEMAELEAASGAEFDRMFLEMMIRHHEGAIEMADVVLADGEDAELAELAENVKREQRAEIEEMRALLDE